MISNEHLDRFVARFIARLPDSFSERKQDLLTLLCLLPKSYARRAEIKTMVELMNEHEREQLKFVGLLGLNGGAK